MSQKRYSEVMAAAWKTADSFNSQYQIGLPVQVQTESGVYVDMTTASEAFALPDGNVSIMLASKTGVVNAWSLFRVRVPVVNPPIGQEVSF